MHIYDKYASGSVLVAFVSAGSESFSVWKNSKVRIKDQGDENFDGYVN